MEELQQVMEDLNRAGGGQSSDAVSEYASSRMESSLGPSPPTQENVNEATNTPLQVLKTLANSPLPLKAILQRKPSASNDYYSETASIKPKENETMVHNSSESSEIHTTNKYSITQVQNSETSAPVNVIVVNESLNSAFMHNPQPVIGCNNPAGAGSPMDSTLQNSATQRWSKLYSAIVNDPLLADKVAGSEIKNLISQSNQERCKKLVFESLEGRLRTFLAQLSEFPGQPSIDKQIDRINKYLGFDIKTRVTIMDKLDFSLESLMPQDLQEKIKDVFGDSHEKTMTVSPEMSIDSARCSQEESQDGNDSQNIKTQLSSGSVPGIVTVPVEPANIATIRISDFAKCPSSLKVPKNQPSSHQVPSIQPPSIERVPIILPPSFEQGHTIQPPSCDDRNDPGLQGVNPANPGAEPAYARFGWYAVEANHHYSIVNSRTMYVIHNSGPGSTIVSDSIRDVVCKFFIEQSKHALLPTDPCLWGKTEITFIPAKGNPTHVKFKIGSFEILAYLPKQVFEVHKLVEEKSAFILSMKRVNEFQAILLKEQLSLCDVFFARSPVSSHKADVYNLGSEWRTFSKEEQFQKLRELVSQHKYVSTLAPALEDAIRVLIPLFLYSDERFKRHTWFSSFYIECTLQALTKRPPISNCDASTLNEYLHPDNIFSIVSPNWLNNTNKNKNQVSASSIAAGPKNPRSEFLVSDRKVTAKQSSSMAEPNLISSTKSTKPLANAKSVVFSAKASGIKKIQPKPSIQNQNVQSKETSFEKSRAVSVAEFCSLTETTSCNKNNCIITNFNLRCQISRLYARNVDLAHKKIENGFCMYCTYTPDKNDNFPVQTLKSHIYSAHLKNKQSLTIWHRSSCQCTSASSLPEHDYFVLLSSRFESVMYGLIVDDIFGHDLVQCHFPECSEMFAVSYGTLQKHLFTIHLKPYVERDELSERQKTQIGPSVCAVQGCGFPLFHSNSVLLQHYAYDHKKVNVVYQQFCIHNSWYHEDLVLNGFFYEPLKGYKQWACIHCRQSIREDQYLLHLDACLCTGSLTSLMSQMSPTLEGADYENFTSLLLSCPYQNCNKNLNLIQLFIHWLAEHQCASRKLANIICINQEFLSRIPFLDKPFFDQLKSVLEVKVVKLVKPAPAKFVCPQCRQQYPPALNLISIHINRHIAQAGIHSRLLREKLADEFGYQGRGCPFPDCYKAHDSVINSHITSASHDMEVCVFYLYTTHELSCLDPIKPYLAEKASNLLKHFKNKSSIVVASFPSTVEDTIRPVPGSSEEPSTSWEPSPSEEADDIAIIEPNSSAAGGGVCDIKIVEVSGNHQTKRQQTRSPGIGIKFVLPRSVCNPSNFIAQCDQNFKSVILLNTKRVLAYNLFKEFIVYLAAMEVNNRKGIIPEVTALSAQINHVLLHDEIYAVPGDLFRFPWFLKVWNNYHLLKRFSDHCLTTKHGMSTCDPMQVVIIMSQFIEDKTISKGEVANFLAIINEVHYKIGSLSLVETHIIKDFVQCEDVPIVEFFQLAPNLEKYLTCTSCFNFDCYFSCLAEATKHIKQNHSRASPGSVGCTRCYTPKVMNVTNDEGSITNFQMQMGLHTNSTEHLRTIYNMSPSLSVVQDDCFVCGVSNVVYQHTAEEKHRNLVKVLDFYLELCCSKAINPFSLVHSGFYLFAAKLMLTEPVLRACSIADFDFVLHRFLGWDYLGISSITAPEYLSATAFCFPCQAFFNDQVSMELHVFSCKAKVGANKPFKCIRCNKLFDKHELPQHLLHFDLRQDAGYDCLTCDETTVQESLSDMMNHALSHPPFISLQLKCLKCKVILSTANVKQDVQRTINLHDHSHLPQSTIKKTSVELYQDRDPKLKKSRVSIRTADVTRANCVLRKKRARPSASVATGSFPCLGFKCLHCNTTFPEPSELQAHYQTEHQMIEPLRIKTEPLSQPALSPPNSPSYLPSSPTQRPPSPKIKPLPEPLPSSSRSKSTVREEWITDAASRKRKPGVELESNSKKQRVEKVKPLLDYCYFCHDCERSEDRLWECGTDCNHFSHPRIPLGVDITNHLDKTGHMDLSPIQSFLPGCGVRLENVSYSLQYGEAVRRKWKGLVKQAFVERNIHERGLMNYSSVRGCLRCGEQYLDALGMFNHIKNRHLPINNKTKV